MTDDNVEERASRIKPAADLLQAVVEDRKQIADYHRSFQERTLMRLSIMVKQGKGLTEAEQAYLDSLPPPEPVLDEDPYHRYLRDGEPWPDEWEDDEW